MSISTNYGVGSYDPSFYDLVKHDILLTNLRKE